MESLMVKNKLLVALAAVGGLGFSVVTSAQSGLTSQWSAVYVGAQGGWGKADYDLDKFLEANGFDDHIKQEGFAGRGYIGYQYNQYLAFETGFAGFSEVDLTNDMGDIQTTQWDLLLRVGTPLGCGFRGDIKLGAAYIMPFTHLADFETPVGADDDTALEDDTGRDDDIGNGLRIVAGASLTYSFWNNFSVDLSYLHTFSDPESDEGGIHVPSLDLVTFGVSYLFPPVECIGW
jgi:hypothetical protein